MFRTCRRCALGAGILFTSIAPLSAASPQSTYPSDWAAPNFFHSVALPVPSTPYDAKWRQAWIGGPGPVASFTRGGAEPAALAQLANLQQGANHPVSYHADSLVRESADCEDDAIAKIKPLLALGFRPQDLYFVVGDDRNLMVRRALMVVRTHGKFWVLDSLSSAVVDADLFRDFDPIITLSADRKWVHGYAPGTHQRLAAAPHSRPLIAPGPKLAAVLLGQDVAVPSARSNRCEARVNPELEQLTMLRSK